MSQRGQTGWVVTGAVAVLAGGCVAAQEQQPRDATWFEGRRIPPEPRCSLCFTRGLAFNTNRRSEPRVLTNAEVARANGVGGWRQ